MKNTFRPIPFVRLLIPMILGISIGTYFNFPSIGFWLFFIIPILGYFAYQKSQASSYIFGVLAFLGLFLIGISMPAIHSNEQQSDQLDQYLVDDEVEWIGIVNSMPKSKNSIEANIQLESIKVDGEWQKNESVFLARFKKDETSLNLNYGDKIIVRSNIKLQGPPTNPNSFDYSKYLRNQGIYHTTYVSGNHTKILDQNLGNPIFSLSYDLRKKGLDILKKYLNTDDEFAVGSALILGYKDEMTEDIQNAFTDTGATHVLAVSGLHVGILLMFIQLFFGLFKRRFKKLQWIEFVVSFSIIWGFALVTGASPSVLRAATMFSFVAFGTAMNKDKFIYNTLAASAFFLLCYDSYLLFNPGFQLSYLAVVGIIFFQPIIYKSWYIKNRIGSYIWKLTSVSLAAQIVTIPISLFYFHQFPTYFLLSGLVVIPAAGFIMGLGLALIFLSKIPFIGTAIGFLLYWLIFAVNAVVFIISKFPGGVIEYVDFSFLEMALGYLSIGLIMAWVAKGKHQILYYALGVLLFISASYSYRNITNQFKEEIVFYDSKDPLIDYFNHGKRITYKNSGMSSKNEAFAAKGHRTACRHYEESEVSYYGNNKFIQLGNKRFFILNENYFDLLSMKTIHVDGIIIENNPYINFSALVEEFDFDFIIANSSNYESNVARWREKFAETGYAEMKARTNTLEVIQTAFYYTKEKAVILDLKNNHIN